MVLWECKAGCGDPTFNGCIVQRLCYTVESTGKSDGGRYEVGKQGSAIVPVFVFLRDV